jgi:hypothetical protein
MTTATAVRQMSVDDRCDRCGAQAYVRVRLREGGDLHFCAHHYSKHSSALAEVAEEVIDESDRLHQHS